MSIKYAVCTLRRHDGALIPEHWHIGTREEAVESRALMEDHAPESLWLITTYRFTPETNTIFAKQVFNAINA